MTQRTLKRTQYRSGLMDGQTVVVGDIVEISGRKNGKEFTDLLVVLTDSVADHHKGYRSTLRVFDENQKAVTFEDANGKKLNLSGARRYTNSNRSPWGYRSTAKIVGSILPEDMRAKLVENGIKPGARRPVRDSRYGSVEKTLTRIALVQAGPNRPAQVFVQYDNGQFVPSPYNR